MSDDLTYGDVRRWRGAPLEESAHALRRATHRLGAAADQLAQVQAPRWEGDAATRAARQRRVVQEQVETMTERTDATRRALLRAADGVVALEGAVAQTEALAASHGLRISDDGSVHERHTEAAGSDDEHGQSLRRGQRLQVQARVEEVLRTARGIDDELAAGLGRRGPDALDALDAGTTVQLSLAEGAGDDAADRSPGRSPEDAHRWWDQHTAAEQQALVDDHPELVGGLDGLPAWARDEANRTLLQREHDRLAAAVLEHPDDGDLQHRLTGLVELQRVLHLGAGVPDQERSLLELDLTKERVEAAVGIGDIDHADHVSTYAPGLTADVDGRLGRYDADRLRTVMEARLQLHEAGRDETVAGISWIGYQAPQLDAGRFLTGHADVLDDVPAQRGGSELAAFLHGLQAAHDGDPHLTAVGDSYGSTVVGYALQHGSPVDDAVVVGSPGLGTDDYRDLQIGAGRVHVLESRWDPVAEAGWFGTDPGHLPGTSEMSTAATQSPDGRQLGATWGHQEYFQDRSTSLFNVAAVMAGEPLGAAGGGR